MGSDDVEMVSFGIGVGDNHRMPYPLEFLSSFLASGVSKILGFRVGGIECVLPLVLGRRHGISLSDQSSVWFLRGRFGGLVFRGFSKGPLTQNLMVGLDSSDC